MGVRKGPTEEGAQATSGDEGALARPGLQVILAEENPEGGVDEVHIPDYVMHDFGFPERRRVGKVSTGVCFNSL